MLDNAATIMFWLLPVIIVIALVMTYLKNYIICPNDKVMVVYGAGSSSAQGAKIIHGGGQLVIPWLQRSAFLSLKPMSIPVDLKGALSANNIRVNVPSQFTISIAYKDQALMQNAVRYLLEQTEAQIQTTAREIIFGSLRSVVATLSIEDLTRNRDKFINAINVNIDAELNKIGLTLINSNLMDITDESGFITAMGQKAASEAVNKANIEVAEQERLGAIGVEENNSKRNISVAEQKTLSEVGVNAAERDREVSIAALDAEAQKGTNSSKADIADSNAALVIREADAHEKGEVAKAKAATTIANEQRLAEQAELSKQQLPAAEVAKQQKVIEAEAEAERSRIIAKGEADAILSKFAAEADGLRLKLEAQAEGYRKIVESVGGDTNAAAKLMMIEQATEIVSIQSQAISNLVIDKVTVWDSGSGNDGVQGFIRNFASSLPALHEICQQAGIELPAGFMGSLVKDPKHAIARDPVAPAAVESAAEAALVESTDKA